MKKITAVLCICLSLLSCLVPAGASAEEQTLAAGLNLVVDGALIAAEPPMYIENDRTMAAGEMLCAALGAAYLYADGVLNIQEGAVVFTEGADSCLLYGAEIPLEATPRVQNDKLYVPLRALAEALDFQVDFEQKMAEDGQSVYASVVTVTRPAPVLQLVVPEEQTTTAQMLEIAGALTETELEFIYVPAEHYREKCMLMFAAGQPVIIYQNDDAFDGFAGYRGGLHDLTPYLAYAPATQVLLEEEEAVRQAVTDESGAVVAFPVPCGDTLERFYIPHTLTDVKAAVNYLNAYSEVVQALVNEQ